MFYDAKGDLDALPESGVFLLVLRADYKEAHKGTEYTYGKSYEHSKTYGEE